MTLIYCIKHEKMVAIADPEMCLGHTVVVDGPDGWEAECCEFPLGFAFCPLPVFPDVEATDENCPDLVDQDLDFGEIKW